MPIVNAGESMIRAFQMGLNEKRAEQDQVAEQERKKIEMDLLKHRIQQMKLEERISAWDMNVKGAEAQAKSFEGLPEAQMAQAGMLDGTPARDLSQTIAGLMPSAQGNLQSQAAGPVLSPVAPPAPPAALAAVQANQPLPTRPVMTPAFSDPATGRSVPSIALRPRTREQITQDTRDAAELKASTEPFNLGYGQKRFVNGKLVAEGGEDPSDAITREHYERQDKIEAAKVRQAEAQGKQYITATVRQAAAKDLYDNINALEIAYSPDPKDVAIREAEAADWEMMPPDKRVGPKPRPVPNRMSPTQLASRKLAAINSYRSQLQLPAYTSLPTEWDINAEVGANPADGSPATPQAPGAPEPPPNENDMVQMVSPTGTVKSVPKADVAFYESYGAKLYIPPAAKAVVSHGAPESARAYGDRRKKEKAAKWSATKKQVFGAADKAIGTARAVSPVLDRALRK